MGKEVDRGWFGNRLSFPSLGRLNSFLCHDEDAEIKKQWEPSMVTQACNPNYSGDGDQEDHGSKPAWAKS
jgi:hypothetical protein